MISPSWTLRRRRRALLVSVALAGVTAGLMATPVAAECTHMDSWPSFARASQTAKQILVGEVVESYANDSADYAIRFRFRVDEVLRGPATTLLDVRDVVRSGAPVKSCTDSILRVRVGDVMAFAFDARIPGAPDPVLAVAWIRGRPDDFLMPGAEVLTLAKVRSLAALPVTDAAPPGRASPAAESSVPLLLAGTLGALAALVRLRRKPA